MLLILVASLARAACDAPVPVTSLMAAVGRAQGAMSMADLSGVEVEIRRGAQALPCVAEPFTPLDAASYHGLMGLAAFIDGSDAAGEDAFFAAYMALPTYRLSESVAPPDGPLDALLAKGRQKADARRKADAAATAAVASLPPYDGTVLIDGTRAFVRPVDRPCMLQLVRRDGTLERTAYLLPKDPLPKWDPPPTFGARLVPEVRKKPSVPFGIAAGGTVVAAGVLYGLGGAAHDRYLDPTTPYEDLDGLEAQTNAALASSIVLGVAGAVLGTVTFLEW